MAMVLLFIMQCLLLFPLLVGLSVWSLFCFAVLCVLLVLKSPHSGRERERASCFTFVVLGKTCRPYSFWLFLAEQRAGV